VKNPWSKQTENEISSSGSTIAFSTHGGSLGSAGLDGDAHTLQQTPHKNATE
jgi:hypothetical protein